jgi:hypothetical protein
VAIKNILIELGTPTWFPSSWPLEKSNISSFKAIDIKNLGAQKYLGLPFKQKY